MIETILDILDKTQESQTPSECHMHITSSQTVITFTWGFEGQKSIDFIVPSSFLELKASETFLEQMAESVKDTALKGGTIGQ